MKKMDRMPIVFKHKRVKICLSLLQGSEAGLFRYIEHWLKRTAKSVVKFRIQEYKEYKTVILFRALYFLFILYKIYSKQDGVVTGNVKMVN